MYHTIGKVNYYWHTFEIKKFCEFDKHIFNQKLIHYNYQLMEKTVSQNEFHLKNVSDIYQN